MKKLYSSAAHNTRLPQAGCEFLTGTAPAPLEATSISPIGRCINPTDS
jgi:hypothetical protein